MRRLARALLFFPVALLAAPASPAAARKPEGTPCAPGTFAVANAAVPALSKAIGHWAPTLSLDGRRATFAGCLARSRTRAGRKATTVTARLARCGALRKLELRVTMRASACDRVRATLKAKRHRVIRFTATRTADASSSMLPPTPRELIERVLRAGQIDYPRSLAYRMWAFNVDPRLPEQFDGPGLGSEDESLDLDIRDAWPMLPAAIRAALAPYMVRPDDPASAYRAAGSAPVRAGARTAARKMCPNSWTHADAALASVRVWDCSSGDPAADAAFLGGIAALFDEHWLAMTRDMGLPTADDGAGGSASIDVYLLRESECMLRHEVCQDLEPSAPDKAAPLARAVRAAPYVARGSSEYSSGYILLKRGLAVRGGPAFESAVVHELFHILQFAHTIRTAAWDDNMNRVHTFFTEASATWAEWVYLPAESAAVHEWWSGTFMPEPASLVVVDGRHEYASYIWPFFVQQERGGPEPIFAAWVGAESATGPADVEQALDAQLDFKTNFREFAVRNLNWIPPGNPLEKTFANLDARFPGTTNSSVEIMLPAIVPDMSRVATSLGEFPPLTTQYRRYPVREDVRHVVIDLGLSYDSFSVDVDAIVKVGDTWKRVPKEQIGRRLEFCRDDPEERVTDILLVLGNHEREHPGFTPNYTISTDTPCPSWTGNIRYEMSSIETSDTSDAGFHTVLSNVRRRIETWDVFSTGPVDSSGTTADGATLVWHGRVDWTDTETRQPLVGPCVQGTVLRTWSSIGGSGSGQRTTTIEGGPAGPFSLGPLSERIGFMLASSWGSTYCPDGGWSEHFLFGDSDMFDLVPGAIGALTPSGVDPNLFTGTKTLAHEEQPRPGGQYVLDTKLTWWLRHRVMP